MKPPYIISADLPTGVMNKAHTKSVAKRRNAKILSINSDASLAFCSV